MRACLLCLTAWPAYSQASPLMDCGHAKPAMDLHVHAGGLPSLLHVAAADSQLTLVQGLESPGT